MTGVQMIARLDETSAGDVWICRISTADNNRWSKVSEFRCRLEDVPALTAPQVAGIVDVHVGADR